MKRCLPPSVVIASVLVLLIQGPAQAAETAPLTRPTVISGCEYDYPPFCIVDEDGLAGGFSVELMRAALHAMGHDVTFRVGPWDEVKGWLERGGIQALPLVGRTPEREELFDFTFPYMSLHGAIVVREETKGILDIRDLEGRRVAVMKGDNTEEFLRREDRGIRIHTTATFEDALRELSQGLHDAVVIQRLVALRLIRDIGLTNLRIVNRPVSEFRQDFCFAVREGDRDTLELLNEGLALVIADGTYRYLHSKWFAALELPSNRRLVIGGDHNYPPYEYLDQNGRPAGYSVELTRAIARELGLDVEIRLGPWARVRDELERGRIDAVQGMLYSPQRDLVFDFSPPHMVSHYVGVVRRDSGPPPGGVEDLAGKRIVVQDGDIMHDFAVENGLRDRLTLVDSQEDALRELSKGRHDCALMARMTALYWIERHGWTNLTAGKTPLLSLDYCYAVPNNQRPLLAQFSEGLKVLEETGEYRRIRKKWLGVYQEEPLDLLTALRYSAMIVIPLLLILFGVFFWSWSLHRQVARRTSELRQSEDLLETIIDSIAVPVFYKNTQGLYLGCNRAFSDFVGLAKEEIIGRSALDIMPAKMAERFHTADLSLLEKGDVEVYEVEILDSSGRRRRVIFHESLFFGRDGSPEGLVCAMLDITERKEAEERVEHLNNVLRAIRDVNQLIGRERDRDTLISEACRLLVDNRGYASALIILVDRDDRPVSWAGAGLGEALERVSSMIERNELPPCCDRAGSREDALLIEHRQAVCDQCPMAEECAETHSLCVRLAHGGIVLGYLAASLEYGPGHDLEEQALFAEMAGDLAFALKALKMAEEKERSEQEREALERQLFQAQKMESVGRLAGGVAHDYNNMLGVIIGYAELALEKAEPGDPLHADLQEVLKAARRSAEITKQLLAFARKQTISPRVLDLNETIEGMLKMLRRLIGEDIDLIWLPGKGLWRVKMDPVQVDQILANLCINARDAIGGVGRVVIETADVAFDEEYCSEHPAFVTGEFVMLAVSDDGSGMDRETMENIFEPFFTTKDVGKGTGLGLATVYGIVKQNSGFINVYSEPAKGTSIKIYLPRVPGESVVKEDEGEVEKEIPRGGGETILVVEDEAAILKLAGKILKRLGYRVLSAQGPDLALAAAREHDGPIHLLLTDVVMPGMHGRDLAVRLQELHPDLRTLFMSGYTANAIVHRGVMDRGTQFMQKPFSMNELAARVRAALDGV